MATAATASAITYIDGDAGVLLYRGYPIEQLAEHSSFLEVSYLLQKGELPSAKELAAFTHSISRHTMLNEWILRLYRGFHHDAHPMAMVATIVASLAAFYHDSTDITDDRHREIFTHRMIAKLPTIAAAAYKHALGPAVHLPAQRPRLHGEHAAHVLRGALRALRARSRCTRRRSTCCSSCTPTTSRTRAPRPCGSRAAPAATRTRRCRPASPRSGARRTAARTRRSSTCSQKIGDAGARRRVPRAGQGQQGRRAAHGLRPPRVQELRPARDDHPRDVPQGARQARPERQPAVRARAAARGSRAEGRLLHQPQALPERRLLLRHHLPRARHPARDVHRDVRDRAHRGLGRALVRR